MCRCINAVKHNMYRVPTHYFPQPSPHNYYPYLYVMCHLPPSLPIPPPPPPPPPTHTHTHTYSILMCDNDSVKISDFGTSRTIGEDSTRMTFAGTVGWMSPEMLRHDPCSEKVDVWSYAVLLWEMLTQEKPYSVGLGYIYTMSTVFKTFVMHF